MFYNEVYKFGKLMSSIVKILLFLAKGLETMEASVFIDVIGGRK